MDVQSPIDESSSHGQSMRWRLGGSGWASWLWSVGDVKVEVQASYVGPKVLAGFMNSVRDLLLGCHATFVTFLDEPGGTRVFFNRIEDKAFVQVVGFADLSEPASWWSDAKPVWNGRVPVEEFIGAFVVMVEELLAEHGTEGYRKRWAHDFPTTEWAALQTAHKSRR
ncbi:hypothetical protein ACFV9D_33195 [Streptomyces sp. NPDC059875]|uniref:hypothetical protein n=1 Tax=unclassified Streptomyces TaxID=2593676 RepID=UPI00365E314E